MEAARGRKWLVWAAVLLVAGLLAACAGTSAPAAPTAKIAAATPTPPASTPAEAGRIQVIEFYSPM